MHKQDQPQTTNTATSRDAAAQIGVEELTKSELIIRGLKAQYTERYPDMDALCSTAYALGAASYIMELLTSTTKADRESGKRQVRELVKLGKGE